MSVPLAIGHLEGFFTPTTSPAYPSRPQRNNNPGDIEFGQFAELHGAVLETPKYPHEPARFAAFKSPALGWAALFALLQTPAYRSLTVQETIYKFAPPTENDTVNYVNYVCENCAVKPTDILSHVFKPQTS